MWPPGDDVVAEYRSSKGGHGWPGSRIGDADSSRVCCLTQQSATCWEYCQARRKLPLKAVDHLNRSLAGEMQAALGPDGRWHGHRVKKVEGTTVSMPDQPLLQKVFPQPDAQKPGCGFPVARLVVMFCRATGAVLRQATGNLKEAEISLFRRHYTEWLERGGMVLADRHDCSYIDLVRLNSQGLFIVYRLISVDRAISAGASGWARMIAWSSGNVPSSGSLRSASPAKNSIGARKPLRRGRFSWIPGPHTSDVAARPCD